MKIALIYPLTADPAAPYLSVPILTDLRGRPLDYWFKLYRLQLI